MTFGKGLLSLGAAALFTGCATAQKAWNNNNTIAMPECSVAFSVQTEGTAFSNQFSNKGLSSTMVVYTPFDDQKEAFQQIVDESCGRLEKKLASLGYTVLKGDELAKKSEKYAELKKEYFTNEPESREFLMHFGSSETGLPKGGRGWSVNMGYGSMSREGNGIVVLPAMRVAFGTVQTSGDSVTDSNGMTTSSTSAQYIPEVVVRRESNMDWMGGDKMGSLNASEAKDATVPWLVTLEKGDTKTSALSVVGNLMLGSRVAQATYYKMKVDPAKMKQAILAQLDKAENDFIAQIKDIKGI